MTEVSREHLQADQDKINEFIEKVNVKKTALNQNFPNVK